jgi:hypothetical protein
MLGTKVVWKSTEFLLLYDSDDRKHMEANWTRKYATTLVSEDAGLDLKVEAYVRLAKLTRTASTMMPLFLD